MSERSVTGPSPRSFTATITVRHSDADELGHVNNAVYLTYAVEAAYQHAESAGFSLDYMRELGGYFVVRHSEIDYRRPARPGDVLLVTTSLTEMRGMRATRRTEIVDSASGKTVASARMDYVWVDPKGRPARIPHAAFAIFGLDSPIANQVQEHERRD